MLKQPTYSLSNHQERIEFFPENPSNQFNEYSKQHSSSISLLFRLFINY